MTFLLTVYVASLATTTLHEIANLYTSESRIEETLSMKKERNFWKIGFFIVSGVLCIFLLTSMKVFYSSGEKGIIEVLSDIGSALESIDMTLTSIKYALM